MNTEQPRSNPEAFNQVSRNLAQLCAKLSEQDPEAFTQFDCATAFLSVGVTALAGTIGPVSAVQFLRQMADKLEAGKPVHQ